VAGSALIAFGLAFAKPAASFHLSEHGRISCGSTRVFVTAPIVHPNQPQAYFHEDWYYTALGRYVGNNQYQWVNGRWAYQRWLSQGTWRFADGTLLPRNGLSNRPGQSFPAALGNRYVAYNQVWEPGVGNESALTHTDFAPVTWYCVTRTFKTAGAQASAQLTEPPLPPPPFPSVPPPPRGPPPNVPTPPSPNFPQICGSIINVYPGTSEGERVRGTRLPDGLFGEGGDDELRGVRNSDCILGSVGEDELFGGRGHDRLRGGRGTDVFDCGPGFDVVFASGGRAPDHVRGDCELVK
jgi:hypothetical protein